MAKLGKGFVGMRFGGGGSCWCSFEGVVVGIAECAWRIDGTGKVVERCP